MECDFDNAVTVSADGRSVLFAVTVRGTPVACAINRRALEQWFWVSPTADANRLLKAYFDGARRINAIATRKALRAGVTAGQIMLDASDF
jgi:hypothetical protein